MLNLTSLVHVREIEMWDTGIKLVDEFHYADRHAHRWQALGIDPSDSTSRNAVKVGKFQFQ